MNEPRYWIAVAPLDHVQAAVAGGYLEVGYGRAGPLERMRPGDRVAFYSPRATAEGEPLQAFTALGEVSDAPLFQAPAAHQPFRRAARWQAVTPAPVRPLLERLAFVRNKQHWGAAFRFGFVRVGRDDFTCITAAMQSSPENEAPQADARPASVASETTIAAPG